MEAGEVQVQARHPSFFPLDPVSGKGSNEAEMKTSALVAGSATLRNERVLALQNLG